MSCLLSFGARDRNIEYFKNHTREVCPSRLQVEPWNAELYFGSSCSKKQTSPVQSFGNCLPCKKYTFIRMNDQGLHLLVRQLAFSALLLGPAGLPDVLSTGNDNDISWPSTAVRRRFSSSSLCHGCSSCVRCCCATIHGKRAIGACTGFQGVAREELSSRALTLNMILLPGNHNTFCEVMGHHNDWHNPAHWQDLKSLGRL